MTNRLTAGQRFPSTQTLNIHGGAVSVPAKQGWVHLQFRRFAGCPVCNLHLQPFIERNAELADAQIREVVVFHSTVEELMPYQGRFTFDVVADPKKVLYRQFGVENSLRAILSPAAWPGTLRANLAKNKPPMPLLPTGGILGLPADFLIAPDGTLSAVHYGKHADDHWSLDQLLALVLSTQSR